MYMKKKRDHRLTAGAFFVDLVQLGADLNFRTYNHNV